MPHSVTSEKNDTEAIMADPESSSNGTSQTVTNGAVQGPPGNGTSQTTTDGDVPMDDAADDIPASSDAKKEVKLEDLFPDSDSDEEFPPTRPTEVLPT